MSYRLIAVAAAAVLALQGCAPKPPPPQVAPEEFNEGIAKTCSFSPVQPTLGGTVSATITMTNDGWCAFRAKQADGHAFLLGLVRQRPANGELLIRKIADETRVEYNPNPGFTGTDSFTVALRPQGGAAPDAIVQIVATVTPGAGVAPAPAAEETKPTTRRAPARRSTRRSTR